MKVLITGANGFVGKNLKLFLKERPDIEILPAVIVHLIYFPKSTIEKFPDIFSLLHAKDL